MAMNTRHALRGQARVKSAPRKDSALHPPRKCRLSPSSLLGASCGRTAMSDAANDCQVVDNRPKHSLIDAGVTAKIQRWNIH